MAREEVDFNQFHETWQRTAFVIIDAPEDADQAKLRECWKRKQLSTHPDKGGDVRENQAVNLAWQILREPELREQYLEFLGHPENRPTATGSPQHEGNDNGTDTSRRDEGARRDDGTAPDYSGWEFEDLDDEQRRELEALLPDMRRRSQTSFFGFWFHWVPIVDSMSALGFLLYFASSDIVQAIAALLVMNLVPTTMGLWSIGVGVEVLLLLAIGNCIFLSHVLRNCTHWTPDYVLSARLSYWLLRAAFGLVLMIANVLRSDFTFNWTGFYIFGFRFFMALAQLVAHCRFASSDSVLDAFETREQQAAREPPKEVFIKETRTSLMLYYDAWLNSFIVCTFIGVMGLIAGFSMVCLIILSPFIFFFVFAVCKRSDRERSSVDRCGGFVILVWVLQMFAAFVACTSWAAFSFANDRLQAARQYWDAQDGIAADIAYGEWMSARYQRAVMSWKKKAAKVRAAKERAAQQAAEQAAQQTAEQAAEQAAEQTAEQAGEQATTQPAGQQPERDAEEGQPAPRGQDDQPETSRQQLELTETGEVVLSI